VTSYLTLISRNSQLQIYRTLVLPVVTYGSESWTLTMEEERALAVFEREVLQKIYGPVKENVTTVRITRLRWAGHIVRM
jgi:hypothetical protein